MHSDKNPWGVFMAFWVRLAELAKDTQVALNECSWAVNPAQFYAWIAAVIRFCRNAGVPTFNQPSWLVLQEILEEKVKVLDGTAVNATLTQVMRSWRDYDYTEAPEPNPMIPYTGPYRAVVNGYNEIFPLLSTAASRLFSYEGNEKVDFAKRTITNYEAADIVWYIVRKMCDLPMFRMQDPQVPKWDMPYPWLEYCEQDLRMLKDKFKQDSFGTSTTPDPGDVPWSMPTT